MKELIKELHKFRVFNRLKSIYRKNSVDQRNESSSEHSWSCLLLADFFLSKIDLGLNKIKVYELLIYHDILEIEVGDTPLQPNITRVLHNNKDEECALNRLQAQLPSHLGNKFLSLFKEFKEQKTREAKFAKLIDSLDPIIHELDYKDDWFGWSKDFFVKEKSKYFQSFPKLLPVFNELLNYLVKNNYFVKRVEYLVKKKEEKNLPKTEEGNFDNLFKLFTDPFMNENNAYSSIKQILAKRNNDKAVYVVRNNNKELYSGILWNDLDVELISNMDYMYCLPSWDWWINPQYPAKIHRAEYLNHIPGIYGNTVIFVNNNKKREENFKRTLNDENFQVIDIKRQYEENNIEFFMFYDYYRVFLPLKLAREINRININIEKTKPNRLYFLLRSGFLISEFFNYPNIKKELIDPKNFRGDLNGEYIVDDCIVMTRNLKKIGLKNNSSFTISILDCAIPKRIYKKEYPNAKIDGPEDLINMFSCRVFEKNPFLIGMDINDREYVYYNNMVRRRFIEEIKNLQKLKNLNKIVNLMAIDLFNYISGGYKNKYFTEFNEIKQNEQ